MIKQNVFIINFNLLYEILDEIKENLSFRIIKFPNEDDFINSPDLDNTNSVIISRSILNISFNKNITEKNFLNFSNLNSKSFNESATKENSYLISSPIFIESVSTLDFRFIGVWENSPKLRLKNKNDIKIFLLTTGFKIV